MTAKAHGLTEFENTLRESIQTTDGLDIDLIDKEAEKFIARGKTLLPPRPVFIGGQEGFQMKDWPMINLRTQEAEKAAQMF